MDAYTHYLTDRKVDIADVQNVWGLRNVNETITAQTISQEHLLFIGRNFNASVREDLTYDLQTDDFRTGFVINCAYNTRPCYTYEYDKINLPYGDFHVTFDPQYGNCFTFNFHGKYSSTRAGPLYGLRLLALSNQKEYLPLTESAGVRVAIHAQNEEPFPDAFGYNAAAGFTTSFGVKYIRTERLSSPYGNCSNLKANEDYYYSGPYSVEGCFRSCSQKVILGECGCGDPRYNLPATFNGKTPQYCKTKDQTERACLKEFSKENSPKNALILQKCQCAQPCNESTYGVTVSTALWPSEVYVPPECKATYVTTMPWETAGVAMTQAEKQDACVKWYGENTMLIEVYYERMNYQQLTESPAYTFVNLISDMGGQLGLWMGISVITMIEFISLGILLCMHCCKKNKVEEIDEDEEDGKGVREYCYVKDNLGQGKLV